MTIVTSANTQDETLPPWSGFEPEPDKCKHDFELCFVDKASSLEEYVGGEVDRTTRIGMPTSKKRAII